MNILKTNLNLDEIKLAIQFQILKFQIYIYIYIIIFIEENILEYEDWLRLYPIFILIR